MKIDTVLDELKIPREAYRVIMLMPLILVAWADGKLYIANHDALLSFTYAEGANSVGGEAEKLMDLPPAGNHWMRNIALNTRGRRRGQGSSL